MRSGLIIRALWCHVGAAAVLAVGCGTSDGPDFAAATDPSNSSTGGGSTSGATDSTGSGSASGGTGMGTIGSDGGGGTTTGASTGPPPIEVSCEMPPLGAVGASYQHAFSATGGTGNYSWSASGLPDGVMLNPVTGALSGTAITQGSYDVEMTAASGSETGMETCTIEVAAGVSVDLSGLGKPCIEAGDDVLAFVQGGNGAAVTCTTPGGTGNGRVPAGISVDASTCRHAGTITETSYGTWVWMTRLEQSGAVAWVPYCQSQATQAVGAYTIEVAHDGLADAPLVPGTGTFSPGQPIAYGAAAGDPLFRITGGCSGGGCFFGFAFSITSSPFDGNTFSLAPSALYLDMSNVPVGFTHEMSVMGPAVATRFEDRTWVLNIRLDYCMTDTDGPCSGVTKIRANGNGNLEYGIIMTPQ